MLNVRETEGVRGKGVWWAARGEDSGRGSGGGDKGGREGALALTSYQRLKRGHDVVKRQRPYAHVVDKPHRKILCQACFIPRDTPLKRCAGCRVFRYCSAACQKTDWKDHKLECASLQKTAPKVPETSVLLLARILRKWDHKSRELDLHKLHVPEEQYEAKEQATSLSMLAVLKEFLSEGEERLLADANPVLRMMKANSFCICDQEGNPVGAGLYDTLCFFNHSCEPNCVITFSGIFARVRSTRDVPAAQELTIPYIDLCQPQAKRRHLLQEQYQFVCQCPRCMRDMEADPLLTLRCADRACKQTLEYALRDSADDASFVLKTTCGRGHLDDARREEAWTGEVQQALRRAAVITCAAKAGAANVNCSPADVAALEKVLPPTHYLMHAVYNAVMDIAINNQRFQEALHFGEKSLLIYDLLGKPTDPLRGIQLLRMANLYSLFEQAREFAATMHQAADVVRTTHGEDSLVYQKVLALH